MKVLGINSVFHESSAALVVDGQVVAAAEEERFTRRKHAKAAAVDNAHLLPEESIRYCLGAADLRASDIDCVAYSYDPQLRREKFLDDPLSMPGDWGSRDGENAFLASLDRLPEALGAALGADVPITYVRHHVAHAASVYYTSCPQDAALLVADGIGECAATVLLSGAHGQMRVLEEIEYPDSIGFLWEKLSKFLGFTDYDASKVMGLAAYGNARAYEAAFGQFVHRDSYHYTMNGDVLRFRLPDTEPLERLLGSPRSAGERLAQRHADIAAALQSATNQIMLSLARHLHELHPSNDLGLAGGVALNCTANYLLKEHGPFEAVHIPAAPHDAGTAIGAALWVASSAETGRTVQRSAYTGPEFSDQAISSALAAVPWPGETPLDLCDEVAELLSSGAIVGWFQGRMEFGPRALGNRSLLADPRDPNMREILNSKVKHREHFRPFAPSVLAECADEWFDIGRPSPAYEAMLFAAPVRPGLAARIPAVVHADGTARLQIVRADVNPHFHDLITRFYRRTGVPMVLNTSFNDSEPIVCTPADAVLTFMSTRIDALAIGNRLIRRVLDPASELAVCAASPAPEPSRPEAGVLSRWPVNSTPRRCQFSISHQKNARQSFSCWRAPPGRRWHRDGPDRQSGACPSGFSTSSTNSR
jgi:carbamoyltransferase